MSDGEDPSDIPICVYPAGVSPHFSLYMEDVESLAVGQEVKGPVVNMYLAILRVEMMSVTDMAKLYVFDSGFYQSILEKRTAFLSKSVENARIFEREMLFLPICVDKHWFALCVLKPGAVAGRGSGTTIVVLDR